MFKKLADNRAEGSLAVQFRRKRFVFFLSLLSRLDRPIHILDVGGTESYWRMMELDENDQVFITLLNLTDENVTMPIMSTMSGDARKIHADDSSYDIVFSNSVIEHVGSHQDQMQMAAEVCRVGKRYFIQTPNKYFPLEPHFLFPFFQFMPRKVQILLLQNFSLGWFEKTPDAIKAREIVESIRLLSKSEFAALFPKAHIYEEKVIGLAKSFIAYAGWDK
ncbi:MAG TPA: class I SAM-dependent methyltransferase [Anaerolineales bacterium]|nr:class I SAM-dependent methyltransferase [Anaerolineales bacterium]